MKRLHLILIGFFMMVAGFFVAIIGFGGYHDGVPPGPVFIYGFPAGLALFITGIVIFLGMMRPRGT